MKYFTRKCLPKKPFTKKRFTTKYFTKSCSPKNPFTKECLTKKCFIKKFNTRKCLLILRNA